MQKTQLLALLCILFAGLAGCATKKIVRAAPPSVSTPPPEDTSPMPSVTGAATFSKQATRRS